MSIAVTCTHCSKSYSLPPEVVGNSVQCAECRATFEAVADSPPPGTFATRCSSCGRWYAAPDWLRNRSTTCQRCGEVFMASLPGDTAALDSFLQTSAAAPTYRPAKPGAVARPVRKKAKAKKRPRTIASGGHPLVQILVGLGICAVGAGATVFSFLHPNPNGQFVIWYGPVIIGLITAGAGLFRLMGGRAD